MLWSLIRAKRLGGFKFRRQYAIGAYIADFACLPARLVIEVGGETHEDRERPDAERTDYMASVGYRVLRFENGEVLEAIERVEATILHALGISDPSP